MGGIFIEKVLVVSVTVLFLLTGISSVYAGSVFSKLESSKSETIETVISNIEKTTDRESILDKYDLSEMPFKHPSNIDRKTTIIDGEYWDIVVPDDYSTIQSAVYAAEDCYSIFVRSGTYEENIKISPDVCSLTIHGENKNTTYIVGNDSYHVISIYGEGESNGINISGFTIENSGNRYAGVYLCSNYNILQGNVIRSNSYGVKILGASGNIVQDNIVIDNIRDGVVLDDYSYGNKIEGNFISGNDDGIRIDSFSTFNVISGNVVEENIEYGLRVHDVSRSTLIIWNIIRGNGIGIDCSGVSDGIFAHHNSFIDNDVNAFDSSLGQWDTGIAGNYWGDYTGIDADGDGIGDTPYIIPGGVNHDNYPLMDLPLEVTMLPLDINKKHAFQQINEDDEPLESVISGDILVVPGGYPTIQDAVDHAVDGDTIHVCAGSYYENVIVDKQLKIEGEGAEVTFVDGNGLDKHIFSLNADYVEISGFTVRDCDIGYSGIRTYGNYCIIYNNILEDCGGGIELWKTSSTTVDSNIIIKNLWGIYIHFSENCNILNNSIRDNYYGIELGVSPVNISVNRIENNRLNGILCLWSLNSNFKNNSIVSNGDIGLQMFSSDYTIIDNNLFYDNDGDYISLHESSYNKIVKNEINITNKYYHGVSLWYLSVNNYIEYNVFSSIEINIRVNDFSIDAALYCDYSSDKNEIRNNNFYGPENINGLIQTDGIELFSDYNIVKDNTFSNYCPGVSLSYCNYNIIESNFLSLNQEKIDFYTAVEVGYKCNYNKILDNIIIGKPGISNHGIELWGCDNTTIDNNFISGFSGRISGGIVISTTGENNYVKNNTITENYFGICNFPSNLAWRLIYFEIIYMIYYDGAFSPSILLLLGLELLLFNSGSIRNSELKYNMIMKNKIGISSNLHLCLIESNSFEHNQKFGIKTNGLSKYNLVRFNNFIGNNIHATFKNMAPFTTVWYNNYWDNWNMALPKPIFGLSDTGKYILTPIKPTIFRLMLIMPTINFDWHPAQEPYNIGG